MPKAFKSEYYHLCLLVRMHTSMVELKCRQHEAELRQSREECWAQGQELAAAQEKLAHLKTTLEDRRKDVVSYKVTKPTCTIIYGFHPK